MLLFLLFKPFRMTKHILITLLFSLSNVFALYGPSSGVVELTPSDFEDRVTGGDSIWIVEFFAPWCGHCQQLVPEYEKAATSLRGIINVGAVDCDQVRAG
jgi:protein disulfide-isomerase A6